MVALLACVLAASSCTRGAPKETVDTVVLISIDSLRADHVGALGYPKPTTPSIDALAERGVVFTRAFSTTSWTLPAHVSMLTGLDAETHGVVDAHVSIPASIRTIAERARAAGVETAGFYSGAYLQPAYGFGRGFRTYANCSGLGSDDSGLGMDWGKDWGAHLVTHEIVTNPCIRKRVADWARSAPRDGKRFLFVHLWDVHFDYAPPPGYVEIFDPDYRGSTDFSKVYFNPAIAPGMPARDLRHLVALYDGEIRWTDDTIAGILADLEAEDLLRDALVVVTSDHGDEFFEHGGKGHQRTLYDEVIRIPLIVARPGGPRVGGRSDEVTSLVDIAPAVCRWLSLACADLEAANPLAETFGATRAPGRNDALAHLSRGPFGAERAWVGDRSKAMEHLDGKIEVFLPPSSATPDRGGIEEFSRGELPRATKLAADTVRAMDERVAEAQRRGSLLRGPTPRATVEIDDATRERLRALGYLSDGAAPR